MRLESCYITGFGKISDRSFTFRPGLNEILEENGWGKTTFATFLKAMFYGAPSKKGNELTDRKHYKPWNGGVYGGSLTFTVGDKTYRVERTFGERDKDDTFQLIDTATGLPSTDFSENLGEELFGVDRDSYVKSIFVPQSQLVSHMTPSLNAKMGDLQKAQDDMNRFDEAKELLEKARKSYKAQRKNTTPGKLDVLNEKILESKRMLEDIPTLNQALEEKKSILEGRRKDIEKLEVERNLLRAKIEERGKMEQELGAFRAKKEQLLQDQERLNVLDDFFVNGIPEGEEQQRAEELDRQIQLDVNLLQEAREKLPDEEECERLEKLFHGQVPSEEEQNGWKSQADLLTELRAQSRSTQMSEAERKELIDLRNYFNVGILTEEEKREVQDAEQKLLSLSGEKKQVEEAREETENRYATAERELKDKGVGVLIFELIMAGLFFSAGCIFTWILRGGMGLPVGLAMMVIAVAILMVAIFSRRKRNKDRQDTLRKLDNERNSAVEKLQKIELEEQKLQAIENSFLERYPGEEESVLNRLREVQYKEDRYGHLKDLEEKVLDQTSGPLEQMTEIQILLYTALRDYADFYGADLYHEMNELEVLSRLERDSKAEKARQEALEAIERLEKHQEESQKELDEYLKRFPEKSFEEVLSSEEEISETAGKCLAHIRSNVLLYNKLMEDSKKLEEELQSLHEVSEVGEERTIEELQKERDTLDLQIEELNRFLPKDMEAVSQVTEELVTHEEEEGHLTDLLEQEQELKDRLQVIDKTAEYLQLARERFLLRYMKPLQDGMKKYLAILHQDVEGNIDDIAFDLDMDLTIQLTHRGQTRSAEYLSAGYQDLTALCARFALVDVLYQKESPTVILDDPFTNLDEEKIKAGSELLGKLSQEKQIIYFTCHESRSVVD